VAVLAAAVCPHPPLLVPAVAGGAASELDDVRTACFDVVHGLLVLEPDVVVVVGDSPVPLAADETVAGSLAGFGIDIVAGGADLASPHHVYQAAMAEAVTGVTPFARSFMHVGAVYQDGAKMAKSLGNLTLVADLLRDYPPAAVRLLILDRRWSAPWIYEREALDRAAGALDDLYAAAGKPGSSTTAAVTVMNSGKPSCPASCQSNRSKISRMA